MPGCTVCKDCGAEFPDVLVTDNFCSSCGASLGCVKTMD